MALFARSPIGSQRVKSKDQNCNLLQPAASGFWPSAVTKFARNGTSGAAVSLTVAMPNMPRVFPSPWSIDEHEDCFIVRDAKGQALAQIYFEDEDSRRKILDRLTRDEARRITAKVAKSPAFVEAIEAKDHDKATKTAAEQLDIPLRDRFHISVRVIVRGDS
jgi:hypothetical protein